ncbi:MAG: aminotransferase class V-fold PLP-dependent enzyme [Flavobacteriaceae bacterium]|nr:aminotransferase class V-fold PLP-dependent enzyme [Flavobacteriaceae bacterium]
MSTSIEIKKTELEAYFETFRQNILGIDQTFVSPYGTKDIVYVDWTASGRLYRPIEEKMMNDFGPYVANTHTETTYSGTLMTKAYHKARKIIKNHVNAGIDDVFLPCGTGMTGAVNKFQRILGLKVPEGLKDSVTINDKDRPVVFISHMEHHSNQTSWIETIAIVEVIPCDDEGMLCLENLEILLNKYKDTEVKIASVTSCSNVTGIKTDYHAVAKLMHQHDGLCFVDFACSAPYVEIDMHPEDEEAYLDAVFFSPHKFLGGPGTNGVLIFDSKLYHNTVPDNPGGGTVSWTTPWGDHKFLDNIEDREDGGTPGFLQVIKTSLAVKLKEKMGIKNMLQREEEIVEYIFKSLKNKPNISILADHIEHRLGVISLIIGDLHHELAVKILNDRFGIQSRGGCSCAGTYGHHLLQIDQQKSNEIIGKLEDGTCELKPGWVRFSIHPTTTTDEIIYVCNSIIALSENYKEWMKEYTSKDGKYIHKSEELNPSICISENWFEL